MRLLRIVAIAPVLAACSLADRATDTSSEHGSATVTHRIDGDTIELMNGQRVRLVQIDSTELGTGECYSRKAAQVLRHAADVARGLLGRPPPGSRRGLAVLVGEPRRRRPMLPLANRSLRCITSIRSRAGPAPPLMTQHTASS